MTKSTKFDVVAALRAIHEVRGRFEGIEDQDDFLKTLMTEEHLTGLSREAITAEVKKFRTMLGSTVNSNSSRHIKICGRLVPYGINDLFKWGPKEVLGQHYLQRYGLEILSGTEGDEVASLNPNTEADGNCNHVATDGSECGTTSRSGDVIVVREQKHVQKRRADLLADEMDHEQPENRHGKKQRLEDMPESLAQASSRRDMRHTMAASKSMKPRIGGPQAPGTSALAAGDPAATQSSKKAPELHPSKDRNWVVSQMDRLRRAVEKATDAYIKRYNINEEAPSRFFEDPGDELGDLYIIVFGKRWRTVIGHLENMGNVLDQGNILKSLFGAAVYRSAFSKELPWNLINDVTQCLGDNKRYLDEIMADIGRSLDDVLRSVVGKQIDDAKFKASTVKHAREAIDCSAFALRQHFIRLIKNETPNSIPTARHWSKHLEEAVQTAFIIRQALDVSRLGEFNISWPKVSTNLDREQHEPLFELPGANKVLYTLLPAVMLSAKERPRCFARALVVPAAVP